jgi:hypothetical protein
LYKFQPHGMGDLYAAQIVGVGFHSFPGEGAASWGYAVKMPHGMGDLYAAQTGCVGFHSFPGEGAAS